MKTINIKVNSIYEYILKNYSNDSDFWSIGGGNNEIQYKLNTFLENDWIDLKNKIVEWNTDYINIIIESIFFGFDGMFTPFLDEKVIPNAANFLLDLFILLDDIDMRLNISHFSFFINKSNSNQSNKLKIMKTWMIENGITYEN